MHSSELNIDVLNIIYHAQVELRDTTQPPKSQARLHPALLEASVR